MGKRKFTAVCKNAGGKNAFILLVALCGCVEKNLVNQQIYSFSTLLAYFKETSQSDHSGSTLAVTLPTPKTNCWDRSGQLQLADG